MELQRAESSSRDLIVRVCAVAALACLAVLGLFEFQELRGELAFARFYQFHRLAEKSPHTAEVRSAVSNACQEARWVMLFGRGNPGALVTVSMFCLRWSADGRLDPRLRLRIGEAAVQAALLAVRAAPSDYASWLWLARSHASLGLMEQSRICLRRARELAPPGMALDLSAATLRSSSLRSTSS